MQLELAPSVIRRRGEVQLARTKISKLHLTQGKRYQHKEWKDERLEKYWQKWEQNSRRIELEKESKAEAIINKQNYRALKNKLYKEKKDKLLEALKKNME